MNEIINVALKASEKAAEIAKKVRESGSIHINFKGDVNLCTVADVECEKAILQEIKSHFPDHSILAEESASDLTDRDYSGPLWIIDPIDGTTNYAHGHNHVGTSIAFAIDGIVQAGVVNVPFQNEVFSAVKGQGALCNNKKISCSTTDNIKSALVCTGFPYERTEIDHLLSRFEAILKDCRDMRRLGACSVDICWVACGRLDAYYEDVMPWDMAAASLIAREAGAKIGYSPQTENVSVISDMQKLPQDLQSVGLVVANEKLLKIILGMIESA